MLSLHHSSIAELFFEAYQKFPDFGRKIKRNILNGKDKKDLGYYLFHLYLTSTNPRNSIDIGFSLGRDWEDEKDGKTILKELIKSDKIQELIKEEIENEKDIGRMGTYIFIIAFVSKEVALKFVISIDINVLSSKINKDWNILKVGKCVSGIAEASKEVAEKVVNNIDISVLSSKIKKEENINRVG